jgi:putative YhbY family RNA-binding protein
MKTLTSTERRGLKAQAHHLHPVIMIGEAGATPAVLKEIDIALKSHELIKIRVLGDDRERRGRLGGEICAALGASPVQQIGKMLVLYRQRPEQPDEAKSKPAPRRGRKPKFRAKRSFQNR